MIYHKKHDFFTKPNKTNSYWAGFIAADGNVGRKNNTLTITLSAKDKEHLSKFSSLVSVNYKPRIFRREHNFKAGDFVSFNLSSPQWKSDLSQNFGIEPAKTLNIGFPNTLNDRCLKAFICGYIDGDGCVYVDKARKNRIQLSTCGTLEMLSRMKEFFETEGKVKFTGEQIYSTKGIYTFMACGNTAMKILGFLYDEKLPLMERKWSRYTEQKAIHNPRTYLPWTQEDNESLRKHYATMTVAELRDNVFPDRSYTSIEKRCGYLGLRKMKQPEMKWTSEEDTLLNELRQNTKMKLKEIHEAHFSHRTFSSLKNRARLYKKT